jgi:UDP-N-acetylmuramoyl-tripeptide--D-alanyl-D-alanine ligase
VRFRLGDVVRATNGRLVRSTGVTVDGVSIDSRSIRPGQLFVPIVGERDGHDFIPAAVTAGAAAYLCADRGRVGIGHVAAVVVDDTVAALAELGRLARRRIPGPVVGVTGSVGKTTVKDLTAAALRPRFRTAAAERSFNNELGVPLTLANADEGSDAAVVEMGARGLGHIAHLCSIAEPDVGIVTRVAPAHLELFGTIDDVAQGKGELVEALPADGLAVLNAEDDRVRGMARRTTARVLTYGRGGDLVAEDVRLDDGARATATARTPWGSVELRLPLAGAHMVGNGLAALAVAGAAGVDLEAAAAGIAGAAMSPWRMDVRRAPSGLTVLNDAYNASPVAVRAAFDALAELAAQRGGRAVAVLGAMAELGVTGDDEHRALGDLAAARGLELVAVGTDRYGASARTVADLDAAVAVLADLGPLDVVLVKASRVVGLERLAARLLGD